MCEVLFYCVPNLDRKIIIVCHIILTICASIDGKVLSGDVTHYVVPDVGSGSGFPGDTGVQGAAGDRLDPDSLPAHPWTQVNPIRLEFTYY